MNNDEYREYLKSEDWKRIAKKRMEIDGNACVMCGCRGTTANPLEVHHLSYRFVGNEESRIYEDLCTLCHTCHKQTHNLLNRQTNKDGRHGWRDNNYIPQISVFTLTGQTLECMELEREEKESTEVSKV